MTRSIFVAILSLMTAIVSLAAADRHAARPAIPYPGGRQPSPSEVALGRELFFDTRLSSTNTIACATCHLPDHGFSDPRPLSVGVLGTPLKRHTPHLLNLAWARSLFWDGRASTLEEQAILPIQNPEEMGMPGDRVAEKLKTIPAYVQRFEETFPRRGLAMSTIGQALASFERTLVARDAPFDRFEAGDPSAMEAAAVRGRQLFFGRAKCSTCHSGPNFTDGQFHNTGVLGEDLGRAAFDRVGEFQMRPYPFFQMRRAFKTPGLRNVAQTSPYQHNGSEATLADVVKAYNDGGRDPHGYGKSLDIRPLHLTDEERGDLVSFLNALTSPLVF